MDYSDTSNSKIGSPLIQEVDSRSELNHLSVNTGSQSKKNRRLDYRDSQNNLMKKKAVPRLLLGSSVLSRDYSSMSNQASASSRNYKNRNVKY